MSTQLPGPALLFCPADRPDRYAKAAVAADAVILDLEDAVAPGRKAAARTALIDTPLDPEQVIVRINACGTADHHLDLAALRRTDYRRVMLPKAERPEQARALADWEVIALCETPLGILNAAALAATSTTVALMWGAEDLVAAIGGRSSRHSDGRYRHLARHARAAVLLAAASAGRPSIDAVYLDIEDPTGLSAEAQDACESGFAFKACIHPAQVTIVREAFQPNDEQIRRARRIIAAAAGGGVLAVDGRMIDAPLIRQAERVVRATVVDEH